MTSAPPKVIDPKMRPHAFLISGWAHAPAELQPLAERLSTHLEVTSLAAHDFVAPQQRLAGLPESAPSILIGWSLGGMLAIESAAARRVAGLVLISSMRRFCAAPDFPFGVPRAHVRALSRGCRLRPDATLQSFYVQAAAPNRSSPAELAQRAERAMAADSAALQNGLTYLANTDLAEMLDSLTAPTLLLHGREDVIVSPAASADLQARLPGSKLHLKNDMGHDLPLRDPDWIAENIIAFLTHHVDI